MKTVKMKLSALKLPERNVRMHTEKQIKEFIRSVEMFGQIRPIVTDENGTILAGNGLYETLKRMGRTEADVLKVAGLSENQKLYSQSLQQSVEMRNLNHSEGGGSRGFIVFA